MAEDLKRINQIEPWYGEEEKMAVAEYLDSGGWLTEFKKTREFEQMLAGYTGSRFACAVNNGTISLLIALMALGIGRGDEVIVPDYTMIASPNAVVLVGAKPVLVDVKQSNLCLDLNKAEPAITPNSRAIMLVSINGRCPDMEKVSELADRHKLFLLEDAAQSLGARFKGRHLGTFGHIGSFSFSTPKIITTGQGGALVTDDEELYTKIAKIKDFGRTKSGVDQHDLLGLNSKFTDIQAVIGIEQMKKLAWRVERKKEIYRLYRNLLADFEEVEFIDTDLDECPPWFIDILLPNKETRDGLAAYLNEKMIGTRPFYPAIHTQPPYHEYASGVFTVASEISARGLWLPSSSFLEDGDIDRVCTEIKGFFRRK